MIFHFGIECKKHSFLAGNGEEKGANVSVNFNQELENSLAQVGFKPTSFGVFSHHR